ncbi:MAG: SDR family oxidoreductase [Ignavibacteriales bacterium]|nr:SDR family oxidoreductase [Ignavibacteriales bacterium]
MILVTGANGNLGKAAINFLLKKIEPSKIAALVRDSKKGEELKTLGVEIRVGDYFDYDSLVKAFKGINKLLLISSGSLEDRTTQHINAINAAKEAGVKHILYTSVVTPSHTASFSAVLSHVETESYLKKSGITYTIFRNSLYLDLIPMLIGDALQSGKIYYPAGDGKVSFTARTDMAEALANVLVSETLENKIYEITGSTAYSFYDIAKALSDATQKQIEYIDVPPEAMEQELLKNNVPSGYIELLTSMAKAIRQNELSYFDSSLENLLGRKPVGLKEFLKIVFQPAV